MVDAVAVVAPLNEDPEGSGPVDATSADTRRADEAVTETAKQGEESLDACKVSKAEGNTTERQMSQASCQDYTEEELEKFLEDSCQWIIFEDPEDEIRFLRRRSGVLACGLLAARAERDNFNEAGVRLQEAYESVQTSYQKVCGDVGYWRELAQVTNEELVSLKAALKFLSLSRKILDLEDVAVVDGKAKDDGRRRMVETEQAFPCNTGDDRVLQECEVEGDERLLLVPPLPSPAESPTASVDVAVGTDVAPIASTQHLSGESKQDESPNSPASEPVSRPLRECQPPQEGAGKATVAKNASLSQEGASERTPKKTQLAAQPAGEPEPEESHEALQQRLHREQREALRAAAAEAAQVEALRLKKLAEQKAEEVRNGNHREDLTSPHRHATSNASTPSRTASDVGSVGCIKYNAPLIAAAGSTPPPPRRCIWTSLQPNDGRGSSCATSRSPSPGRGISDNGSEYSLSELADRDLQRRVQCAMHEERDSQGRGSCSEASRRRTPLRTPTRPDVGSMEPVATTAGSTPGKCLVAPGTRTPVAKPYASSGEHEHSVGSACGGIRRALFSPPHTSGKQQKQGSAPQRWPGLGTPTRRKAHGEASVRSSVGGMSPGLQSSRLSAAATTPCGSTPRLSPPPQPRLSPPPQFPPRTQRHSGHCSTKWRNSHC